MGASGNGGQCQLRDPFLPLQNPEFGDGGLSVGMHLPQEAGQRASGDGSVDGAGIRFRASEDEGVIGFFHGTGLQQTVGMG